MKCSFASFSDTSRTRASLEEDGGREGGRERRGNREREEREGERMEEGRGSTCTCRERREGGREGGREREKYSVYIILTMAMFIKSQSFISLPSFMFVSAAVSEIHDLNQNKKFENV